MKQYPEYIKISSSIHRLNPIFKIFYFLLFVTICFLPNNINYLVLANFIIAFYLLISSKVPFKYYVKKVLNLKLIIIAMFIIYASFSYSFINSLLIVLKFIFSVSLFWMIIYTTTLFDLSLGIYNIFKHLNILGINKNRLFSKIYNFVSFKQDYIISENQIIEGLEIKGKDIRHRNILFRFFTHIDLIPITLKKRKKVVQKREYQLIRNGFDVEKYINTINNEKDYIYINNIFQVNISTECNITKLSIRDFVYFFAFILLIVIYLIKVI